MRFMSVCLCFLLFSGSVLLRAQDFKPDENGGWIPALEKREGVFTVGSKKSPRILSALAFKVDPDAVYELSGKFRSDSSEPQKKLLFFGAEAYTAGISSSVPRRSTSFRERKRNSQKT